MAVKYDASSIKILEGLEAVRKRPGMYIGSTDKRGLHHLVWEIVDNAIDEAINGYGDTIKITLHKDKSISVEDHGRGVPTGMHSSGKSAPEVIYTVLHAGGKFEEGGYKVSGGLHGVGGSVVNALSKWMEVNIKQDKKEYVIRFENGGKTVIPLKQIGTTARTGTIVRFLPDDEIFSTTNFSFTTICERMQESAFLIKGITIEVINEEDGRCEKYHYEDGLTAFVNYLNEEKKPLHNVISFEGVKDKIDISIAMQYTDSYSETIVSFVNDVKTVDGGTHEVGFKTALTRAFNDYAKNNNYFKGKDKSFEGSDVREGLTAVISLKVPESLLQFEGQTKGKLGTASIQNPVANFVYEKVYYFLKENKSFAKAIMEKIMAAANTRTKARKATEEARSNVKANDPKAQLALSGKLVPPNSREYEKCELFIVEGDSAGGSAKKCRDRKYQGLLPLRGKPKNISTDAEDAFMKNEELSTLTYTIGTGAGKDFNIKNLHYDKIIIMTDADTDGSHIQNLLLNFFYKKMKPLIEQGHIYVACPPLYRVAKTVNKKTIEEYCWTDADLENAKKKIGSGYVINRYKGLGEMDANQLWETTMDPKSRRLIQVTMPNDESAGDKIDLFMGKDASRRQKWINEYIDFSNKDDFMAIARENRKESE